MKYLQEPKKEPELKPALKKPKQEKKAPPQKSAPPPALPKEDQVEKKQIVELQAKEETIEEKVFRSFWLISQSHNHIVQKNLNLKIYFPYF